MRKITIQVNAMAEKTISISDDEYDALVMSGDLSDKIDRTLESIDRKMRGLQWSSTYIVDDDDEIVYERS